MKELYAIYLIGIHFEQDQIPLKGMELQEIKKKDEKDIIKLTGKNPNVKISC